MIPHLTTNQQPGAQPRIPPGASLVNGAIVDASSYFAYPHKRLQHTLECVRQAGARDVMELGAHPWAMTSRMVDDGRFNVVATVSAEEVTPWPDDIGVTRADYELVTSAGRRARFANYSANLERTRFAIPERPDTILACEIVEHLIRSPHVMLLNANDWLPVGGKLIMSTPNGAQLTNVFRRRAPMPQYRANVYERHSYLYTKEELADLVELCGFRVREIGYWDVYRPQGFGRALAPLMQLPVEYVRDKTMRTIYVVAEKRESVAALPRAPRCYDPRGRWDYIAPSSRG